MRHPVLPHLNNSPINWPSYQGVSQLIGEATDGRVGVYVDPSLGPAALKNAQDLLADADRIVAANDAIFGSTAGDVNVIIFALGGTTDGTGGADHMSCNLVTGGNLEVDAAFGNSAWCSALFEAELSECYMNGRLCGLSTGEGLSRWCALATVPNALANVMKLGFGTADIWFRDGMRNYIDRTAKTDRNPNSNGCSMAFISWLLGAEKQTLPIIAKAMVKLGNRGTLAQLYAALTGDAHTNAWLKFQAAVKALPNAVTNDDPFGGLATTVG